MVISLTNTHETKIKTFIGLDAFDDIVFRVVLFPGDNFHIKTSTMPITILEDKEIPQ